jgi:hypothetical protein
VRVSPKLLICSVVCEGRDFIYIDALHENHFAKWYIANILKPAVLSNGPMGASAGGRPVPVQIHDVYNPYMIYGGYSACVNHSSAFKWINQEIECLQNVTKTLISPKNMALKEFTHTNMMYGPDALSGEGYAVADFLAYLPFDARVFSISPFKDMELFTFVHNLREKLEIQKTKKLRMHWYNPSIYFTIANAPS